MAREGNTQEGKIIRRRLAGSYLSTVISISLVLLLIGAASLLLVNASSVSDYFKENMQVSVMMKPEVSEAEAILLQDKMNEMPFIRSSEFISKEQGTAEMAEMLGADFLSVFETSPIPISVEVTLKADYVSADSLEVVKAALAASPLVDEVVYQQSLVDALNQNLSKIETFLGIFMILLMFISFVLINNTVRLNVFSKRFSIHTMKLVGATRGFIRAPFMVQAVFQGIIAALIAIALLVAGMYFLRQEFVQLFEVFSMDMLLLVMGIVLVSGIVICLVSTYFVVNKLVSLRKDDLYY
ncbi:MAG: permease-like cell division protein FtsX [Bacteroidales bacterium]|nr:permease-like cell division protein FtsX [Bacteroidales bacterium]